MLGLNHENTKKRLSDPLFFTVIFIICGTIEFAIMAFVEIPFVKHIIVAVLHRSTTRTGRTDIYTKYLYFMTGHWKWGYGLGRINYVVNELFGYTNVQNALLQWIIKAGAVTTTALFLWLLCPYLKLNKIKGTGLEERKDNIFPILIIMYTYMFMGIVEITYLQDFFMWAALIFAWARAHEREETKNETGDFINAENS